MTPLREQESCLTPERYLDIVCEHLPVVDRAISNYGTKPLAAYLEQFTQQVPPAFQPRNDLFDVISGYTSQLLGRSVAERLVYDLAASPVVLSANHHGIDSFSHSIQGNLLFSLRSAAACRCASTVPVFSFGNVPLNNATYPRGLLIYHINADKMADMPLRLPVFPDRDKRKMVCAAPAFDPAMLDRAGRRLDRLIRDKQISSTIYTPATDILQKYCATPAVAALNNYSQQAVLVNNRIWKRLFCERITPPELIYIESEKIVARLLEQDLQNTESLPWAVMFDPELRQRVISELNGVNGCWELKGLCRRSDKNDCKTASNPPATKAGTLFFWGIDHCGRRIPFYLASNGANSAVLQGIDDRGRQWELPYSPEKIIGALQKNILIPSLFTCFLTLSFARGVICAGGYFQGEYLPSMQQGIVSALEKTAGYHDVAAVVGAIPSGRYLSGMIAVMTRSRENLLIPSGPLEIIAGGGLTLKDIERMRSMSLQDAHLAGLFESLPDAVFPENCLPPGWKMQLAADCYQRLREKVVLK